jgi:5-methyltetrahydrofolate--homocysteine methyltransferase
MVPEVLAQMRAAAPDAPLIVKPNAGLPRLSGGQTVYDVGPEDFAARVYEFIEQGAQIVGSCCGSSPAFIQALSKSVE